MSNISTEMLTSTEGDVEYFKTYVPITQHFAVKFIMDSNVNMVVLYNLEKHHDEHHLISKEFRSLLQNFVHVYIALLDHVSVVHYPAGDGRLTMRKIDGMVYLKGCLDPACKGIKLTLGVKDAWKKKHLLMYTAFEMELNYR